MLRHRDDRGFTLVELSVAMSVMLLVAGALFSALDSGTKAERSASTRIDDEQSIAAILAQLTRDVRNGGALQPGTTADEIDLIVNQQLPVRWSYDPATHVLWREIDPTHSGVFANAISVGGLTNPPDSIFTFTSADGANLLAPPVTNVDDVLSCAVTVGISLTSQGHPPLSSFTEATSAPIHAAAPQGCP